MFLLQLKQTTAITQNSQADRIIYLKKIFPQLGNKPNIFDFTLFTNTTSE
jgi:hypothetical protein